MGRWREATAEFAGVLSSMIKPVLSADLVPYPRVHARRVVVNPAAPARARRSRTRALLAVPRVVLRHRIRHAGRPW
ncbi:hypothetical protein [Microbispora bryophytorum]|uniref:Uncharacterized protein n=1 Tax=Microbispora bryophytorum subsp. camponoti TaxID=1677852 RepID=A0ABR8LBE0_9ACTN|nr:hypothetical protein [Microbispora camponoti]MBD3145838.1 hypothetical protein [Microbispora camponoti]